ncbi:MAG: hypothetical protein ACFCD0_30490 [Gemmataceae bacterium]
MLLRIKRIGPLDGEQPVNQTPRRMALAFLLGMGVLCTARIPCQADVLGKAYRGLRTPPKAARFGGKYSMLLTVRSDPGAKQHYGTKKDLGYLKSETIEGFRFPAGYRVYLYPNWYVWATKDQTEAVGTNDSTSANGKYQQLLRKLYVPQDKLTYKEFTDFGSWQGTSYQGFDNLPVGYWVYVYPYWYIWESRNPNWKPGDPTKGIIPQRPGGNPGGVGKPPVAVPLPVGIKIGPNMTPAQRKQLANWLRNAPAGQRQQAIQLLKRALERAQKK